MRFLSIPETFDSEMMLEFNYGNLEIFKTAHKDSDIVIQASVRDLNGTEALRKDYSRKDLAFDQNNFVNEKMCLVRAYK